MKQTFLSFLIAGISLAATAQLKTTTSAIITFDATTPLDNLPKAENKTVVAAIEVSKYTVQFEAAVKSFEFSNPRMQDHFNGKNWMNSEEYPKATFSGVIKNPAEVNFKKDGTYKTVVEGDLTIKGKTQKINTEATFVVSGNSLKTSATFSIKIADFDIDAPPVGAGKVSKEPKITVSADF
jgi:polyisoprenoid-binding protein YceI